MIIVNGLKLLILLVIKLFVENKEIIMSFILGKVLVYF